MTDIERVRRLCRDKGVPVHALETALGFSNGYLNPKKAKTISYTRAMKIAAYFNVPISEIIMSHDVDTTAENKKSPAPEGGEARQDELTRLFSAADPWVQEQVLSLLRAAESAKQAPGEGK